MNQRIVSFKDQTRNPAPLHRRRAKADKATRAKPKPNKPTGKQKKRKQATKVHTHLGKKFPAVFNPDTPLPLKIGVHDDLLQAGLPFSNKRIRSAVGHWCSRPEYQKRLAAGGQRYNLQGKPAEKISAEHREAAAERLSEKQS
jgi:ProP effector